MKAALYARVSTNNGDQNPEVQLDELRAWAQRLGYEVTAAYVDRLSGTKDADERPALTEALRAAHRHEYDWPPRVGAGSRLSGRHWCNGGHH